MIKRILVALDPDSDTLSATKYATDIAQLFDAQVTGLAVVDLQSIEASSRGGGIGSFYYAKKLEEKLTAESRQQARLLLEEFEHDMAGSGVNISEIVQEGVPFERIVEDMKYYDILVIGNDPHFFYAHPKKDTHTLARVVKRTIGPTLAVGKEHREVRTALVAYDGSDASARAARRFIHMHPFGYVKVHLVNVAGKKKKEAELKLNLMSSYLSVHGFDVTSVCLTGSNAAKEIIRYAEDVSVDLIVAGAHSVSAIARLAFGSTTSAFLHNSPVPVFLDN